MTINKKQKYLKRWGLIIFIAILNMTPPLSLDMYLPAVPSMTTYFMTSATVVNLTLVGFFFFLAVGILLFGPLSEKYGRKPILLIGILIYLVFSIACALSGTIVQLILARVFQALGAGCMIAVSTAIIKDSFEGKTKDNVLAVVQAMAVIAPMIAPLVGAFILQFATWRATFWVLVGIAVLCAVTTLFLEESLEKEHRYEGTLAGSIGRLGVVGKNKGFSYFLGISALLSAPYMAYIAVCSYIYIDFFALSATGYSYYFAVNSAAAILGPILYVAINGRLGNRRIMAACLVIAMVSGGLILTVGKISALLFLLAFLPFTIAESVIRPFSTAILLDQQEQDAGSASSLLNCVHTVLGSLGMVLGTLPWGSYINGLGIVLLSCAGAAIVAWILLLRSNVRIIGLTGDGDKKNVAARLQTNPTGLDQ